MEKNQNLAHWESWAQTHGTELRATTKCMTIKRLEIEALARQLNAYVNVDQAVVLEIGCGNGFNGFALTETFANLCYVGLDFSGKMIENAAAIRGSGEQRMAFGVQDARALHLPFEIDVSVPYKMGSVLSKKFPIKQFDAVFTDRMLINLSSPSEQLEVMTKIASALKPNGVFLMLENSAQSHARLNAVRETLGLAPRSPASYNIFIDEQEVIEPFKKEMKLVKTESMSGVHDLMLYAVLPASSDGNVQYDSPLMTTLTRALLHLNHNGSSEIQGLGQNVLWVWQKS